MNKTLSNVVFVFAADTVVKVISAATAFAVARLLGPADYGLWIGLSLLVTYAPIMSLGTVESLLKLYPLNVGRGDDDAARKVEQGVLGSLLSACAAMAAISPLLVYFLARWLQWPPVLVACANAAAIVSLLSAFAYHRFAAHQSFRYVSLIDSFRAVLTLVVLCGFTVLWGVAGTVVGFLATELTICLLSWRTSHLRLGPVRPDYDPSALRTLIATGLPITIIWWTFIIQSTSDRLVSLALLGEAQTGLYSLGASFVSLVVLLPTTVSRVLYPRVNERLGSAAHLAAVESLVVKPATVLSILLPMAIGTLALALPWVYTALLPKYQPGLHSAQILILGCFFASMVRNGANFLVATNRHREVLAYVALSVTFGVGLNVALARAGGGINAIAFGSSAAACILTTLVWRSVLLTLRSPVGAVWREIGRLYVPYIVMVVMVTIIELLLGITKAPSWWATRGLAAAIFALAFWAAMLTLPTTRRECLSSAAALHAGLLSRTA